MRRTWLGSVLLAVASVTLLTTSSRAGDENDGKGKKPVGKEQVIKGELTEKDPDDKVVKKGPAKIHTVKLVEGTTYRIDLRSDAFDSYLRLENADGKQLAQDDDGGGFPHARIIHKATADGDYRIIATSFDGKTGKYTLTVRAASPKDVLAARIQELPKLTKAEQKRFYHEFKKDMQQNAGKLAIADVQMMMGVARSLERGDNGALAAEAYADFGKILSGSSNEKFVDLGKLLTGAGRRAKLVGNPIVVHGQTLAGEDFDWSKYKGKVVLVDFWATWCPPCIGEIPNIKKMYKTYHKRGFDVVAVSLDKGKDEPTEFMKDKKLPWVCLFDQEPGKGLDSLAQYYGVFGIPQAILVGRDGRVISLNARGDELERLLEKHIGPAEDEKKDKSGDNK